MPKFSDNLMLNLLQALWFTSLFVYLLVSPFLQFFIMESKVYSVSTQVKIFNVNESFNSFAYYCVSSRSKKTFHTLYTRYYWMLFEPQLVNYWVILIAVLVSPQSKHPPVFTLYPIIHNWFHTIWVNLYRFNKIRKYVHKKQR